MDHPRHHPDLPHEEPRDLPKRQTEPPDRRSTLERMHQDALDGDSFENASAALEGINGVYQFRKALSGERFAGFHAAIEAVSTIRKQNIPAEQQEIEVHKVVDMLQGQTAQYSPRIADMYNALLAEAVGEPYIPKFDSTRAKMEQLGTSTDQRSDLDILFSGDVSWEMKRNRIEKVLQKSLAGMRSFDERDGNQMDDDTREWRQEQLKKAPSSPQPKKNRSKPGVDPMERHKEGEKASPIWSIDPAWGGYFKESTFTQWDEDSKEWVEEEPVYSSVNLIPLSDNKDHDKGPIDFALHASAPTNEWIPLPVPYTHGLHKIDVGHHSHEVRKDQYGNLLIYIHADRNQPNPKVKIVVHLAPDPDKKFGEQDPSKITIPKFEAELSEETETALLKIGQKFSSNLERAHAIKNYIFKNFKYLAPKDLDEAAHFNAIYRTSPKGFAGGVDEARTGDCDVLNTFFAALCARLKIPVSHNTGHSVSGKDENGRSNIHSGTGHAWSEVWNERENEWIRIDATPAGDPNLDEEKKEGGEAVPGDYGQPPQPIPSQDALEKLREKMANHTEQLSYTREERELAEQGNVEPKEARKIVKEIKKAESTRLPNGERIIDILGRLFNAIVESRRRRVVAFKGPVSKRQGGQRIQDIVAHQIGIKAGQSDPASRERRESKEEIEQMPAGLDVYMIGDKSGSMGSTTEKGEQVLDMQRLAEYLITSCLYRFGQTAERAHLQPYADILVRTQAISFRGERPEDIDLDKPLSNKFTAVDKVKMWHSLSKGGSSNGDVEALTLIYNQIKNEIEEEKLVGKKPRLRIVIACSDGGYFEPEKMKDLASQLGELGVVVVGMGLTEHAQQVPIVMHNPPHSRGDIARDVTDLPFLIAKHVVREAIKLFPAHARKDAQRQIDGVLKDFGITNNPEEDWKNKKLPEEPAEIVAGDELADLNTEIEERNESPDQD